MAKFVTRIRNTNASTVPKPRGQKKGKSEQAFEDAEQGPQTFFQRMWNSRIAMKVRGGTKSAGFKAATKFKDAGHDFAEAYRDFKDSYDTRQNDKRLDKVRQVIERVEGRNADRFAQVQDQRDRLQQMGGSPYVLQPGADSGQQMNNDAMVLMMQAVMKLAYQYMDENGRKQFDAAIAASPYGQMAGFQGSPQAVPSASDGQDLSDKFPLGKDGKPVSVSRQYMYYLMDTTGTVPVPDDVKGRVPNIGELGAEDVRTQVEACARQYVDSDKKAHKYGYVPPEDTQYLSLILNPLTSRFPDGVNERVMKDEAASGHRYSSDELRSKYVQCAAEQVENWKKEDGLFLSDNMQPDGKQADDTGVSVYRQYLYYVTDSTGTVEMPENIRKLVEEQAAAEHRTLNEVEERRMAEQFITYEVDDMVEAAGKSGVSGQDKEELQCLHYLMDSYVDMPEGASGFVDAKKSEWLETHHRYTGVDERVDILKYISSQVDSWKEQDGVPVSHPDPLKPRDVTVGGVYQRSTEAFGYGQVPLSEAQRYVCFKTGAIGKDELPDDIQNKISKVRPGKIRKDGTDRQTDSANREIKDVVLGWLNDWRDGNLGYRKDEHGNYCKDEYGCRSCVTDEELKQKQYACYVYFPDSAPCPDELKDIALNVKNKQAARKHILEAIAADAKGWVTYPKEAPMLMTAEEAREQRKADREKLANVRANYKHQLESHKQQQRRVAGADIEAQGDAYKKQLDQQSQDNFQKD